MTTSRRGFPLQPSSRSDWLLLLCVAAIVVLVLLVIVNLFVLVTGPYYANTYQPLSQVTIESREFSNNQWSEWNQMELVAGKICQPKIKAQKAEFKGIILKKCW